MPTNRATVVPDFKGCNVLCGCVVCVNLWCVLIDYETTVVDKWCADRWGNPQGDYIYTDMTGLIKPMTCKEALDPDERSGEQIES